MPINDEGGLRKPTTNPNNFEATADLKKARSSIDASEEIPDGYVEVRLSTIGKVLAPESFHIRNLNTEDLMGLAIAEQDDLPHRLTKMLDDIIFEHDDNGHNSISVKNFHEKEVIELLLFLFESFYGDTFYDQEWPMTEEDWNFLAENFGGRDSAEFRERENAIKNKTWKPTFDIPLATAVHYHEIGDDIKLKARVKKVSGFEVLYGLPKFGDVLTLKKFIDSIWKEKDKQFASIGDTLKRRQAAEERLERGENVNLRAIPDVPTAEKAKYKDYEYEKTVFALRAMRAIHMLEVTGSFKDAEGKIFQLDHEDVSAWPFEKKMILAVHPELDHQTFDEVKKRFDALEFGLKDEITVKDPILDREVSKKHSFRLDEILEAMRDKRPVNTDIVFE
jgi:hypothetical protein